MARMKMNRQNFLKMSRSTPAAGFAAEVAPKHVNPLSPRERGVFSGSGFSRELFNKGTLTTALTLALLASGCSTLTRQPYAAPQLKLPAAWTTPAATAAADNARWWQALHDAQLDALMQQVLAHNNDLASATIQLRRAQLQAGIAASNQRPTLAAQVGVNRRDSLIGDNAAVGNTGTTNSASVSISYEADLWNRLGNLRNSAEWSAKAQAQDLQSTALALSATTANLYWSRIYLNERLALARQSVANAEKILALVNVRYQAGTVSGLDVAEAQQNLAALRVSLSQLQLQYTENGNALKLLLGDAGALPQEFPDSFGSHEMPPVPAGLPADLLARRPDLRASELRLRAAYSDIRASQASFYPALTLTGSVGGASPALSQVLQNPVVTLGAGLVLPFLNWQANRLNLKVSEADYGILASDFRQKLLTAFTEVENALAARDALAAQEALLQQSFAAAQKAEKLYEIRYRAGAASLQDWLTAQDKRISAQAALAATQRDRLLNHATLCQALGGAPLLPAPG